MNPANTSSINLRVAVDLYAERRRLKTLSSIEEANGNSEQAALYKNQSDCIYSALCVLAKYYGFNIEEVMSQYLRTPFSYEYGEMKPHKNSVPPSELE